MFEIVMKPRVSETNAAGHIGNTVVPIWFEEGRTEFFRDLLSGVLFFTMLVRIEQNFRREIFYGSDVLIKTAIERVGSSSVSLTQEVWQNDSLVADGKSVVVHIDMATKRPTPISEEVRVLLEEGIALSP